MAVVYCLCSCDNTVNTVAPRMHAPKMCCVQQSRPQKEGTRTHKISASVSVLDCHEGQVLSTANVT